LGAAVLTCNPSHPGDRDQEDHGSNQPGQIVPKTLSPKNPTQKQRLLEWLKWKNLPSKHEALSSNPNSQKGKVNKC
jgi:hypothetical protein